MAFSRSSVSGKAGVCGITFFHAPRALRDFGRSVLSLGDTWHMWAMGKEALRRCLGEASRVNWHSM